MPEYLNYDDQIETLTDDPVEGWPNHDDNYVEQSRQKTQWEPGEDEFSPGPILFGEEEQEEPEQTENRCPECDVERGEQHEDGCELEICAGCWDPKSHCTCEMT